MQNSNVTMSQCLITGQRSTLLESQLHWKRGCCSQLLHHSQAVTRVSVTWNVSQNIWSLSQTYPQKRCRTILPEVVAPSFYTIHSQDVTHVSLRRRATLQGWRASLYVVSMPIWVSEGINCCNCYGPPVCSTTMSTRWSQLQSKVVAPELLLSLSSSCCPSGDLQGQPSLLFARMRLLCQPLLLVRIDFVIAIKDEIIV